MQKHNRWGTSNQNLLHSQGNISKMKRRIMKWAYCDTYPPFKISNTREFKNPSNLQEHKHSCMLQSQNRDHFSEPESFLLPYSAAGRMMFTEGTPEIYGNRNCHADGLQSEFYELFESVFLLFSSSHLAERIRIQEKGNFHAIIPFTTPTSNEITLISFNSIIHQA